MSAIFAAPLRAGDYVAMTSPYPPYSINKGLSVQGIAVDILAMIMTLSGSPMNAEDVKLMLWKHGLKITAKGPHKIMLNVPKTSELAPMYKWVGPIDVNKYVIIGRRNEQKINTLAELNDNRVSTIRNSLPEKAMLASGVQKDALHPSVTHVIPLKKLQRKMVDYFAHTDSAAAYMMKQMDMRLHDYTVLHTFQEVPIYYAFSKDTKDSFIARLNENLVKMKKPGKDGKSRYDKIVAKYLPHGVLQ